jgi:hypothetical protein
MYPPVSHQSISTKARNGLHGIINSGLRRHLTFSAMNLMTENKDLRVELINPTFLLHTFVFHISVTIIIVILFMYKLVT